MTRAGGTAGSLASRQGAVVLPRRLVEQWQIDDKAAALSDLTLDEQMAAVAAQDVLDDGEAEAGAAEVTRARRVDPEEPLGDPRQMFARDAGAVIAHRDAHGRAAGQRPGAGGRCVETIGRDLDRLASAAVFDGVVDQVGEQLDDL